MLRQLTGSTRRVFSRSALCSILPFAAILIVALFLAACDADGTPTPMGPTATPVPPTATPIPPSSTPTPRAIEGSVTDSYSGKPIANAEIVAGGVLTETGTDGMFYYTDVPLNAKIEAKAGGYAPVELETGIMNRLDIKLRPSTISGRVVDATTGQPLANVLVKLVLPTPAAAVTATQPLTPSETLTPTEELTPMSPTTDTQAPGRVLAAPPAAATTETVGATSTSVKVIPSPTGPTNTPTETKTPLPPTATPTPKPIPPAGDGFVAVYTDEGGNYFFQDVPEGASLTFKMPGYKLTKVDQINSATKDMALEEFKVNAIYMTANWVASPDLFEDTLDWVKDSRINAVVINVQNDASEWVFDTQNEDVLAAGNTDEFLTNMADVVKDLKSRGLYVIARIVTFQQKTMAENKPEWAVLSSVTGQPWKGGYAAQQKWLDASNPEVQDHLVAMTKEILQLGFDEIQYDYVRFPSDPAPSEPGDMVFAAGPITDTGKTAALKTFLSKAYAVIQPSDAFMDIDVFGYSLWPDRDGAPILGVIGQVIPELIDDTDYISPMIYPSHFSAGEQGCDQPAQCAYQLVHKSGEYAQRLFAGKRTKYRPWLEDFDWPGADYTSPGTTKVTDQIKAAAETGAWGWMMWDASITYEPRSAFNK